MLDAGLTFPEKTHLWLSDKLVGHVQVDPGSVRRATATFKPGEHGNEARTLIADKVIQRWRPVIGSRNILETIPAK